MASMLLFKRLFSACRPFSGAISRDSALLGKVADTHKRNDRAYATEGDDDTMHVIGIDELRGFIVRSVIQAGGNAEHGGILANVLIAADYRGHYSHGMNRLGMYLDDLQSKICRASGQPALLKDTAVTAWVDGRHLLGAVVGQFCIGIAIEKAAKHGIGCATANNCNHFGIAGFYTMQAASKGFVGVCMCNTSPLVFPTRGKQVCLGTNPLSVAAPGVDKDMFVLDMATTTVAYGKVELAKRKRTKIPPGWGADSDGRETTDPDRVLKGGGLLPLGGVEESGGYKGYALAMMVELFCGILADASWGPNVRAWKQCTLPANLGLTFVVLNPNFFAPGFKERMQLFMDAMRKLQPSEPGKPVLVPGDPEREHSRMCDRLNGIPYGKRQLEHMYEIAEKLKVTPPKAAKDSSKT